MRRRCSRWTGALCGALLCGQASGLAAAPPPESAPPVAGLAYFVGRWRCTNLDAREVRLRRMGATRGSPWLQVEQAGEPAAFWGPAPQTGGFVQVGVDVGGARWTLHSRGWRGEIWDWQGAYLPAQGAPTSVRQRFCRRGPRQFIETFEVRQGNAWTPQQAPRLCRRLPEAGGSQRQQPARAGRPAA